MNGDAHNIIGPSLNTFRIDIEKSILSIRSGLAIYQFFVFFFFHTVATAWMELAFGFCAAVAVAVALISNTFRYEIRESFASPEPHIVILFIVCAERVIQSGPMR